MKDDTCYCFLTGRVIDEPGKTKKGTLFFHVLVQRESLPDATVRIMAKGDAADAIVSRGDHVSISCGDLYFGEKCDFALSVTKRKDVQVTARDEGIITAEEIL